MTILTNNKILYELALDRLQQVIDPEIGLNVLDLGLIYEIHFDENSKKIICRMTLTTEFCPMGEAITEGVYKVLQFAFPEHEAEIHLTFDPPWNQSRISEQGRIFLTR